MRTERLRFENHQGLRLAALLDRPETGPTIAYALYAHCFTCSKNLKTMVPLFEQMTEAGIAVFRFDFTGIGGSEGDFSKTNFHTNVADLMAAAEFMSERYGPPSLLVGHSLGASAVLKAAARIPSCRAVVTIAASYDPSHLSKLLSDARKRAEIDGEATVVIGGYKYQLTRQFFHDLDTISMRETLGALNLPLLILHSPADETVPIEHASKIFREARHPKSFVSLHPADHILSEPADSAYAGRVIAAWASRYIHS